MGVPLYYALNALYSISQVLRREYDCIRKQIIPLSMRLCSVHCCLSFLDSGKIQ